MWCGFASATDFLVQVNPKKNVQDIIREICCTFSETFRGGFYLVARNVW